MSKDNSTTPPTRLLNIKPTRKVDGEEPTKPLSDQPTRQLDEQSPPGRLAGGSQEQTVHLGAKNEKPAAETKPLKPEPEKPKANEPAKTRPIFSFKPSEDKVGVTQSHVTAEVDGPVIGWLVIVKGPGKGKGFAMTYGLNNIGREAGQDIVLDLGDEKISRVNHAHIEFDPKERSFYLSKGENLVYLNAERVGNGMEKVLATGDEIELGETTLRFVAFCSADFDWSDE